MRAERLAAVCGPTDALECVARFVVRHAKNLAQAEGTSGGAEQEMLRHGVDPCWGSTDAPSWWKARANDAIFHETIITAGVDPGVVV